MNDNGIAIESKEDFAAWIRLIKQKYHIAFCDIAEAAGLSDKTIEKYAKGDNYPNLYSLIAILNSLEKKIIIVDKEHDNE